ncbi:unnamed protein product [Mycena citricolor]|uniref:N-acetyltransferase domain-containing protein n=1 Tax=Mycena citricolor TaxID=2018698 RepID=A0AAD2GVV4_9AGAR|nr:unnamed protein product [Mycena citricolor]
MILDRTIPSKTGRTALVPPSEADDEFTAVLRSHSDTKKYLRFWPDETTTADARTRRLSRHPDPSLVDFNVYAQDPTTGLYSVFAGTTGIFAIDDNGRSCEVGILISPDLFRGGFATDALHTVLVYAFEERMLHRAQFQTSVDNPGMRGWLEKAGAVLEGTRRAAWSDIKSGGYTDVCVYSILAEEWFERVKDNLEARMQRNG